MQTRDIIATLMAAGRLDLANVFAYAVGDEQAPLPSKTATKFRDDLGALPQFAKFTDDAWVHLGNHVKKYGDTRIVFTGALQTLLISAYRRGKALPMTEDYAKRVVPKDSTVMKKQYAEQYFDWLEDAGIVEKLTTTAKQALRTHHTKKDEALAKDNPRATVVVYVAGETLPGIIALLKRYGAKMGTVAMA